MTRAISALGEAALLLPASLLLLAGLLLAREGRVALGWVAALAGCGVATALSKLAFHACGRVLTDFDVVSPSGHASFAALFYGALAALVGARRPPRVRLALGAAAFLLAVLIGASRVRLWAHSPEEVAIGLGIGAACLLVFAAIHARAGRPALSPWPVAAAFAVALALLGGRHLPVEGAIASAARRLATALDVCAEPAPAARDEAVTSGR